MTDPSPTAGFRLATTRAHIDRADTARRRRLPNGLTPEQDTELRRLAAAAIDACNRVIATATRPRAGRVELRAGRRPGRMRVTARLDDGSPVL